jgi:hypothetical protein
MNRTPERVGKLRMYSCALLFHTGTTYISRTVYFPRLVELKSVQSCRPFPSVLSSPFFSPRSLTIWLIQDRVDKPPKIFDSFITLPSFNFPHLFPSLHVSLPHHGALFLSFMLYACRYRPYFCGVHLYYITGCGFTLLLVR